jgi:type III secretory pathway lipoprotein EscJ
MEGKRVQRWLMGLSLFLVGCREVALVDNQLQSDAAKIVALLAEETIDQAVVESDPSFRGKYRVTVPSESYAKAMQVITRHGYPKNETQSFAELTESSALNPASREVEAIKADRALSVEIEQVLGSFSGIEAPAVLVRHHQCKRGEVSTMVVLGDVGKVFDEGRKAELLRVVSQAVPGILVDNISLVLTPRDQGSSPDTAKTDNSNPKNVSSTSALLGAFGIVGVLGMLIGALLVLLGSKNKRVREPTSSGARSSKLERPKTS